MTAQLAVPHRQPGLTGVVAQQVVLQRLDLQVHAAIDAGRGVHQAGQRRRVVGAVHRQHLVGVEPRAHSLNEVDRFGIDPGGIVEQERGIAVTTGQILRTDPGAVRRHPAEGMPVHRRRDAAPDASVPEARPARICGICAQWPNMSGR